MSMLKVNNFVMLMIFNTSYHLFQVMFLVLINVRLNKGFHPFRMKYYLNNVLAFEFSKAI